MNAVSDKPAAAPEGRSSPAPRRARPVRNILRVACAVVVLAGIGLATKWWLAEGRYIESTDNAYVQADISVLGPRIDGDVAIIHVSDNQVVKAGDPLITLDPTDWQARLDQARGNQAEIEAAAATARRQVEQSRAAIAQADAMIAQAQAELTRASAEAGRSGSLVGAGWTSRQANEQAVADARKAEAVLASARAQRGTAEQGLAVAQAQAMQADSRRLSAAAAVKLAESNLSYTVIRAPFDGVVGNRAAQLGQHVIVGQQLISVTPPVQRLYVVANFKETQLRRVRPGQKVALTADIDSGVELAGHVDSLAPATGALFSMLPPENATGNFTKVVQRVPVKVVLDPPAPGEAGPGNWLRAGLSVTAEVDTRGPDAAPRLGLLGTAAATLHLR
jgi:membrane fusion protein, multidrug efflux system